MTLGKTYSDLQLLAPAVQHSRTALELLRRLHGDDHLETMRAAAQLGTDLSRSQRSAEAEPLLRQALGWQKRQTSPDKTFEVGLLIRLAILLGETDRTQEAEATLAEARPLLLQTSGENSLAYVIFINAAAGVKRKEGDLAGAAAAWRSAIELRDRIAPGDSQGVAPQMNLCTMRTIPSSWCRTAPCWA